jgi:hypothetical protein
MNNIPGYEDGFFVLINTPISKINESKKLESISEFLNLGVPEMVIIF